MAHGAGADEFDSREMHTLIKKYTCNAMLDALDKMPNSIKKMTKY